MLSIDLRPSEGPPTRSVTLAALRIGVVAVLAYACGRIVLPFMGVLLWSAILAVLLYPLHLRLMPRLGNRGSAILIGVVGVATMLAPMVILTTSLATSASTIVAGLQAHTLAVPPPPERLAQLPLIGQRLTDAWELAATNAPAAFAKYSAPLRAAAAWVVSAAGRLAAAELSFVLAFGIAAVLVAYGKAVADFARRLLQLLSGSAARGVRLVALTAATIRGVALGVLGVAAIQAALLAVGFFGIGLPTAAILTVAALLLGVVQVPATLMTLPVIAYVFATEQTLPAIIFAVWTLVAGLSDNVLKPLMLGRGLEVPMPVILIGVIGGMIADGLLGLFIGPVLLAIAYVLFTDWFQQQQAGTGLEAPSPSP
jgi:predicted PurR-regulated permease PerM